MPDPLAAVRARYKDIATSLQQIVKCSEPAVGAARARLEQERDELGLQLHSALPLTAQLRSATTHLKAGLAAFAAMAASIQELELVLEDRRRSLEDLRSSTLGYQEEVDALTKEMREEEAVRLAAVASHCSATVGGTLGAQPTSAPAPQMTYEELAAAFLARSPPSIANSFQQWLDVQVPVSAAPAPSAAPAALAATAAAGATSTSLTAQLIHRKQQRSGAGGRIGPSTAPAAVPPPAPTQAPLPPSALETQLAVVGVPPPAAIEVDSEESTTAFDWSGAGLALPVDHVPTPRSGTAALAAFGKVLPPSRTTRGAPYSSPSELAEAAASVEAAEELLASSPPPAATSELPGGVMVKVEGASA